MSDKFERCVQHVKAQQTPACKASGYEAKRGSCANPWAVCHATLKKFPWLPVVVIAAVVLLVVYFIL